MRRLAISGLLLLITACGHGEEQWNAEVDKCNRAASEQSAMASRLGQNQRDLDDAQRKVAELTKQLADLGVQVSDNGAHPALASASIEDRERAVLELQLRARLLDATRLRFDTLKKKLDDVEKAGVVVTVRHNRLVVSLPGDAVFEGGREALKKEGKEMLAKIAAVMKADPSLAAREFQVAGHTDNKAAKGGAFKDNWALSLMRAREVLVYLVDEKKGALPRQKWSAAGFAETDPIASNDNEEGRAKNRRCELVMVPTAEEVLDLKALAP